MKYHTATGVSKTRLRPITLTDLTIKMLLQRSQHKRTHNQGLHGYKIQNRQHYSMREVRTGLFEVVVTEVGGTKGVGEVLECFVS